MSFETYEIKLARNYYNTLFLHREEANIMVSIKIEALKNPKYLKIKYIKLLSSKKMTDLSNKLKKIK
jgi:hypothetical protein